MKLRQNRLPGRALAYLALGALALFSNQAARGAGVEKERWAKGPAFDDPNYFPIAVWLQDPRNAERYKAAGINLYVALWRGPTSEQLELLRKAGMQVICGQNSNGLAHKDDPIIIGWMHGDEPDNAQPLSGEKGYGPPISPELIVENYRKLKERDPSRPVMLNLGQGVAWDNYIGRGVRRNHPEDYRKYAQGCDIVSFDIYPVVHENEQISGKLEYVPLGVRRLIDWTDGQKIVWNCIEASHISNPDKKAGAAQVRSEVWMSIIQGSRGLIYFVHQFKPRFVEASLLEDAELLAGVTAINKEVAALAPIIKSAPVENALEMQFTGGKKNLITMVRRGKDSLYVFAASLSNQGGNAQFSLQAGRKSGSVEVSGEARSIGLADGGFHDAFKPYEAHIYRIPD